MSTSGSRTGLNIERSSMEKRKFKIIAINDWYEDRHMEDGDACHMSEGDLMRARLSEYEEKIEGGKWPGLPFECMAEDEDEAVQKYNDAHCNYDYFKATEVEFEDIHEWESFTPKQLMCTATSDTLFRVIENDDEKAVVLNEDFEADDEGVLKILYPYLDRKVREIEVGMSEDPLNPKDRLPTVWVRLEDEE